MSLSKSTAARLLQRSSDSFASLSQLFRKNSISQIELPSHVAMSKINRMKSVTELQAEELGSTQSVVEDDEYSKMPSIKVKKSILLGLASREWRKNYSTILVNATGRSAVRATETATVRFYIIAKKNGKVRGASLFEARVSKNGRIQGKVLKVHAEGKFSLDKVSDSGLRKCGAYLDYHQGGLYLVGYTTDGKVYIPKHLSESDTTKFASQ